MKNPSSFSESFKHGLLLSLAVGWAIPWLVLAVACFVLVVLLPVGMLFVAIAVWPFKWLETRRCTRILAWSERDRPMDFEGPLPWEV